MLCNKSPVSEIKPSVGLKVIHVYISYNICCFDIHCIYYYVTIQYVVLCVKQYGGLEGLFQKTSNK